MRGVEGLEGVCSHDSLGSDNNWGQLGSPNARGLGGRVAGPIGAMEGYRG